MNKTLEYSIDYKDIKITNSEIAEMMGYAASDIPEMVNLQINEIKQKIKDYCRIKAGYILFENIQLTNDSLIIEGEIFKTDKIIASSLKGIDS